MTTNDNSDRRQPSLADIFGMIAFVCIIAIMLRSCKLHWRAADNSAEFKWNLNQNESLIDDPEEGG